MKALALKVNVTNAAVGILLTGSVLLSGCQSNQVAEKTARLIPTEALVGEWSGFSEEHGFYLMKLQPDGSGFFGYMPYRGVPTLLTVSNWQCEKKRLTIKLVPIDENPKGIQKVEGPAGWLSMTLTISGPGWQRQIVFHREDDREQRQSVLKARMTAHTAGATTAPKQK